MLLCLLFCTISFYIFGQSKKIWVYFFGFCQSRSLRPWLNFVRRSPSDVKAGRCESVTKGYSDLRDELRRDFVLHFSASPAGKTGKKDIFMHMTSDGIASSKATLWAVFVFVPVCFVAAILVLTVHVQFKSYWSETMLFWQVRNLFHLFYLVKKWK